MSDTATISRCPVPLLRWDAGGDTMHGIRAGRLTRVTRGVYAPADQWAALAPWRRYLARVHAAAMRHPDAVFALDAASAIRGYVVVGDPLVVHVVSDATTASRSSGGVRVHTVSEPRAVERVDGLLVTTAVDTVVDIARTRHHAVALAVADAALRKEPHLRVEHFVAANESRISTRGRRLARWPLHNATSDAESPLESIDRAVIDWLGFPEPELQHRFLGASPRDDLRVDKWWPQFAIAGESDGDLKYLGDERKTRTALRARHRRDAELFARGVAAVPHWGWAEVVAVDPLRAILRSAGLPLVRPENSAQLLTLREALTSPHPARENTDGRENTDPRQNNSG